MEAELLDNVLANLADEIGLDVIRELLDCAAMATGSTACALVAWRDGHAEILAAYNLPLKSLRRVQLPLSIFQQFARPLRSVDVRCEVAEELIASFPLLASRVTSIPLRGGRGNVHLTLTCFDDGEHAAPEEPALLIMTTLANAIMHQLRLIGQLTFMDKTPRLEHIACMVSETPETYRTFDMGARVEEPSVTTAFLLRTLTKKRKLVSRQGVGYSSVRTWRAPVKEVQIAALRSLKEAPPDALVQAIAAELTQEALALAGPGAIQTVVAVPCGHSGPGCLSQRIGRTVAEMMDISFSEPFQCRPQTGSSHPKTNARRPRMQMHSGVSGCTLLVDDVVTSGAHIVEATHLLRSSGAFVIPLAWIGGQ